MQKRDQVIKKLKVELDPQRFNHSLRVEKVAEQLAKKHGVSAKKAALAGLLHDYARKYNRPQLLKQAEKHKIKIDQISRFEPKLLHGELSALLAQKDFGIKEKDLLAAIKKHTLGSPAMSKLEKIIYLADHIEEGRDYQGLKKIRDLAFQDLDQAVVAASSNMLDFLVAQKLPIHPGAILTRNYYLMKQL